MNYVGQQLGNYRLLRLVGQGGFADVYLGEHLYLKTPAAIKVVHMRLESSVLTHFLREARMIARLDHPHIVRVLEFGIEGTIPFLVMNYAPLGTLRQRHPKGSVLSPDLITGYIQQIASALQYAHQANVIHRDVKPENMLLGLHKNILLTDFGLSIVMRGTESLSPHDPHTYAGTTAYMAPEQFAGKPCLASDQYALGIVAYEWFCGTWPFVGTDREIAAQHLSVPPRSMRERGALVTPDIEHVVMKALAKDPQARFACVEDFARALEHASRPYIAFTASPTASLALPASQRTMPIQRVPRVHRPSRRAVFLGLGLVGMTTLGIALAGEASAWYNFLRPSVVRSTETPIPTPRQARPAAVPADIAPSATATPADPSLSGYAAIHSPVASPSLVQETPSGDVLSAPTTLPSPTPSSSVAQDATLAVRILRAPSVVRRYQQVHIDVGTNITPVTVTLHVTYDIPNRTYLSPPRTTDSEKRASLFWLVNVPASSIGSTARLTVVAADQQGNYAQTVTQIAISA